MYRKNLRTATMRSFGLWVALLLSASSAQAGDIVYTVESPEEGGIYAGVSSLRGWAVSSAGIDRVEFWLDGVYKTDIPMGAARADVGANYPTYPNASTSGFAMAQNFGNPAPGAHKVTYKIYDLDGAVQVVDRNVTTIKIGTKSYLGPQDTVSYTGATFSFSGQEVQVTGMQVNGVSYNATLRWDLESQQLQFTSIN